jgi:phosphate transport system substrate-binding protein
MGKITSWDAPAIKSINPGLKLPALAISVVHRSDGSGTTFNWVSFLSRTSPAWKTNIGSGLTVAWPVGVGGDGNAGVAAAVTQTSGAVGYVEYTYALQNAMTFGQVQNAHGLFIAPSAETFQAAASTVDWKYFKDFNVSIGDAAGGPDAYPITATTFILMYKSPKNTAHSTAALAFFKWALEDGDDEAGALHYVALPPNLVKQVEIYWSAQIAIGASSAAN